MSVIELTAKLKFGESHVAKLLHLAEGAKTDIAGIVQGIVTMYLSGSSSKKASAAVEPVLGTIGSKGKRMGRPPKMTDDEVGQALELRARNMSYAGIGQALGHSDYVVRDTLKRSPRARA